MLQPGAPVGSTANRKREQPENLKRKAAEVMRSPENVALRKKVKSRKRFILKNED